ncbi:MAG: hypothetical protein AAF658_16275, partial [Myxococcota bacterium]
GNGAGDGNCGFSCAGSTNLNASENDTGAFIVGLTAVSGVPTGTPVVSGETATANDSLITGRIVVSSADACERLVNTMALGAPFERASATAEGCAEYSNAASGGTLIDGISPDSEIVGRVLSDAVNPAGPSATAGSLTLSGVSAFENRYRAFSGEGFIPSNSSIDNRCSGSLTACRIFDGSLRVGAQSLNAVQVGDGFVSTVLGRRRLTHDWSASTESECDALPFAEWVDRGILGTSCETLMLRGGIEVPGSRFAPSDGLCTAGDTCIAAPNIGAYQGHGALSSFAPDELNSPFDTNVFVAYASNGYSSTFEGCADGTAEQNFYDGMVACEASETFANRENACAAGYSACDAAEFVALQDSSLGVLPSSELWVNESVRFELGGSRGSCRVDRSTDPVDGAPSTASFSSCSGGSSMLVCPADSSACTCTECTLLCNRSSSDCDQGFETIPGTTLDESNVGLFGGCLNNGGTAGTLCCPD